MENMKMLQVVRISIKDLYELEEKAGVASKAIDFARDIDIPDLSFPKNYSDFDSIVVGYSSRNGYSEWAAYIGPPEGSETFKRYNAYGINPLNLEWVINSGSKLNAELAKLIFPEFEAKGFRYRL